MFNLKNLGTLIKPLLVGDLVGRNLNGYKYDTLR